MSPGEACVRPTHSWVPSSAALGLFASKMSTCSSGPRAVSLTLAVRCSGPLEDGRKMTSPTGASASTLLICSSVPFLKSGWSMRRRTYWRVAGALALAASASCLG